MISYHDQFHSDLDDDDNDDVHMARTDERHTKKKIMKRKKSRKYRDLPVVFDELFSMIDQHRRRNGWLHFP